MLYKVVSAASTVVDSGSCGSNLTWSLTTDNVLTISGSGTMDSYTMQNNAPWYKYASKISKVVMDDNITSIGNYAFYNCTSLTTGTLPESLVRIGEHAFENCTKIATGGLPKATKYIEDYAFNNCTSVNTAVVYDTVNYIGKGVFANCTSINTLVLMKTLSSIDQISVNIGADAFNGIEIQTIRYSGTSSELKELYTGIITQSISSISVDKTTFEFISRLGMNAQNGKIETVASAGLIGDVDCNGVVNFKDSLLLKKYILKQITLDKLALTNADVTEDGVVNAEDYKKLNKYLVGEITFQNITNDVNCDGIVNVKDSLLLKKYVLGFAKLDKQALTNADANKDGVVNTADITELNKACLNKN